MDAEELMWKNIYEKINKQNSTEEHTEHEKRIQQVDGGFFEKFGSLFRESAEITKEKEEAEKQKLALAAAEKRKDSQVDPPTETDSDAPTSSDSENEDQKDKTDNILEGAWNIDELYSEILYEILHNVGCDINYETSQTVLFSYLQDAFKMSNETHKLLLEAAEKKEAPDILLNVEVIEAKDLAPKDSNGLSDPFVTLYLNSNTSLRYNTSVKMTTLNPTWEEHFALPVTDENKEDHLMLEVWDFDPAESVKEKFGKIFDVKGVKGIRKLVKEIAVTAATGQHENELIGTVKIPLKSIPSSGLTMWYSIEKKSKCARQGVVKVRISFGSSKNNQVAEQEYRHLLRTILLHELEKSKASQFSWNGIFSAQAEAILSQHIAQSGLTANEVAICQWSVYSRVHINHALSFTLFANLLENCLKALQSNTLCEEDVKIFWEGTKKLLPSCFTMIRRIRKKAVSDKNMMKTIVEVLRILSTLQNLESPGALSDLFPANLFPWIKTDRDNNKFSLRDVVHDAVVQGASDWFNHILENYTKKEDGETTKLQNLIQIIQLVRSDLQKAIEFYDKLFQQNINFSYARTLYTVYQEKLSEVAQPEIEAICKKLKKLSFNNNNLSNDTHNEPLTEGTTLFETYLAIQRFVVLGEGLCPSGNENFQINTFHNWFHDGVAQWLEIALYKALLRIEKAVELDSLIPLDEAVKITSSAVDTLTIFYQINNFWAELKWPDVEGCYTFIAKIIDDICRCCVFYSERMSRKVDGVGISHTAYDNRFEVTNEWCLAINNIEHVRRKLEPFTQVLGMNDVVQKISDLKSTLEAERCKHTLDNVIANAIDTVRNSIIEMLEMVINKMAPAMKRLLIEGAELFNQDSNSVDRLMGYVDTNLSTLHRELNEENFNRTLEIVWDALNHILQEIIQSNIDKRRPPSFFANLHKTLDLMLGSFKNPEDNYSCDGLKRTENLLKVHGLETPELIHRIHLDMWKGGREITETLFGELTVRAKFQNNNLIIEVMNGRNLKAMDSNGLSDTFVRIHLLPEEKFTNVTKPKTATHYKNVFPLYEETFELNLTDAQRNLQDGLILFSVKDKDMLRYHNAYIAEAFIHFKDIPATDKAISELPQVQLKLLRPGNLEAAAIKALEHRQGDKLAKDFLKKFKERMGT